MRKSVSYSSTWDVSHGYVISGPVLAFYESCNPHVKTNWLALLPEACEMHCATARAAHRTETVNAERSKTRKHHRTDLITRLPRAEFIIGSLTTRTALFRGLVCAFSCHDATVFIHGVNIKHTMRIKRKADRQCSDRLFHELLMSAFFHQVSKVIVACVVGDRL